MKKTISLLLVIVMMLSLSATVFAANDYTQGTAVIYNSTGTEDYTITVPAALKPGQSGTVTLSGTWADNRTVTVTADKTVTLTNSIKATDQKVLDVTFAGISEAGSNTDSQTFTETVSVAGITNALFGTWSGIFEYNVETFVYDDSFPFQWNSKAVSESNNPKFFVGEIPFVKISNQTPSVYDISNPTGGFENGFVAPMDVLFSIDGMIVYSNTWGAGQWPLVIVYTPGEYEYDGQMVTIEESGTYFIDVYSIYDMNDNCTFKNN